MNSGEAQALVARLHLAYPRQRLTREHYNLYAEVLLPLHVQLGARLVDEATAKHTWFPSVAELYDLLAEITIGAPGPLLAWEQAANGHAPSDRHPLVQRAMHTVGGSYAIRTSENPVAMRAHFVRAYEEWLGRARHAVRTCGNWRDVAQLPTSTRREITVGHEGRTPQEDADGRLNAGAYLRQLQQGGAAGGSTDT